MLAAADFLHHSVPSRAELEDSVRRLAGAGLLTIDDDLVEVAPAGEQLWRTRPFSGLSSAVVTLQTQLNRSSAPGDIDWTLDEHDLRRRRPRILAAACAGRPLTRRAVVSDRVARPRAGSSLTSPMVSSPKWNTLAASTASAPAATAGGKCSTAPAPPLAITGMSTTARTASISSRSKPALVPSASIELSRISPAPSSATRRAHSIASSPALLAAAVRGDLPAARRARAARRTSSDSTSTWLPNRSAISAISSGRWIAAVLTPDLVGARAQQHVHVLDRAHSPADGQRDEDRLRGAPDHVEHRAAVVRRRR